MNAQEVIEFAKENNVKFVDLKLVDVPGTLQHLSLPIEELTTELFEEGTGFDGSSIRGFQSIDESDMLLVPDPSTAARARAATPAAGGRLRGGQRPIYWGGLKPPQ